MQPPASFGAPDLSQNGAAGHGAEEKLRESEDRYLQLVALMPAAVYACDAEGRITFYNHRAVELWGRVPDVSSEQFCACYRVFTLDGKIVPPHETPMSFAVREGKAFRDLQAVVERPDGSRFVASVSIDPIRDAHGKLCGAINVFQDISERYRAEEKLRESEERFRAFVTASSDVVYRMNADWSEMCQLQGRAFIADTLKPSRTWIETYIPPEDHPRVLAAINHVIRTRSNYELEHRIIRVDGTLGWTFSRAIPRFDAQGEIVEWIGTASDITERKEADETLRRSHETFLKLVENSPFGLYVIDSQFRLAVVSAGAQPAFRNVRPLIGHDFAGAMRIIWPEPFATEAVARFRHTLATGEPYIAPSLTHERHDIGTVESYEWQIQRITLPDGQYGVVCHYYESTALRQSQEALRRSEVQLTLVSDSVPALISYVDGECRYQMCNRAYTEWFGLPREEILGREMREVLGAEAWKAIGPHIHSALSGETADFETEAQYARGGTRWIHAIYTPHRDERGQVIGVVIMVSDITSRKQAEEALRQAHVQLADRAVHLEQLVQERTATLRDTIAELEAFSYSIAHDMRAPLRAMNSYASILEHDVAPPLPPEARNYTRRISASAQRLDALITDVLNYSKVARSELPLEKVDVERLTREIVESYPNLHESGARILVQSPLPPVIGNTAALTQCISNLLSNAIKFVTSGITPRVTIRAESRGDFVRLWFEDNGIGFSEEGHKRIFRMFERLNPAAQFEGTGIGLTIVRKAVERMGGRVGAESQPGVGSQFWIELRRAE